MGNYKNLALFSLTAGSILLSHTAQAFDLTTSSLSPVLTFNDTDDLLTTEWTIGGQQEEFFIFDASSGANVLSIFPGTSNNNGESFVVEADGDVNLAKETLFLKRDLVRVGIGTTTPEAALHINKQESESRMMLESSDAKWGIATLPSPSLGIILEDELSGNVPFRIDGAAPTDSIRIATTGVGIGVEIPQAMLDVAGKIVATVDGNSSSSLQELFKMSANNTDSGKKSDAGFVIENARENFSYAFRTLEKFIRPGETIEIDGGFAISKQATGEKEFVLINPTTNDPTKVELYLSNGASNVNGQWVNASSRSYKKNIHELSGEDAMQAMRGLKSVTYEFKRDAGKEQMIGFIAEDVPELVATKSRKTLDPMQIVSVLTKAMQVQDKSLIAKDKKIAEMQDRAEKNTSRLEKLEAQLMKLMIK